MFSLKELIFTPEVASQSLNLFHNPAETEINGAVKSKKSTVKRRDKGLDLETSFYQPRRLELGDFFDSENEEDDEKESSEKVPKVRKVAKARKTDKSIPRYDVGTSLMSKIVHSSFIYSIIHRPILSTLPSTAESRAALYRSSPHHNEQLFFNGKLLHFAPNHNGFLKFPQDNNFLINQRQHIRNIWQRCFLAKDYVGAIMVSPSHTSSPAIRCWLNLPFLSFPL